MADDFDKEAPDAMDHQIVGETLPDFSVVVIKNEVVNLYDSEFESTISSVQYRKPFFQEEIGSNALEALSSEITDTEYCQSNILNSNKIILGSKPNILHGEPDHFAKSAELYQENNVFLANDTQLNPNSIDENYFEELVTSYEPKVELHDIQSYLHKSRRFCESCGILFPEPNTYETHMQMYHTKTNLAVSSHKNNNLAKRRIYKCTLCDKKFVAPHVLRNHLNNIHKLKNKNETKTRKRRYKRALCNTMPQHRCYICGLKFVAPHVLKRHLKNIHKLNYDRVPGKLYCQSIMNTVNDIKSPSVNRDITSGWSNTCFHCKKLFDTQKSLIEHLYDILQMKRKNTEIVPVLKSILFKCNKCDINFTSSQFAANHAEHMEMLINWKCTICNRIFKNEDALSHERQHSVTNNFLVYNLEDLDVTKFLYKCSKCAVHFTESNFLYHFRDCGLEYSKFVNCNICNMSLDYNLKPLHESDKHTGPNDYTIIESDVISDIPVKSTANKYQAKEKLKELVKSFREVKVVLQKIDSSKLNKLNQLNTEKWCSDDCLSDFESGANYEEIRNKAPELQRNKNKTSSNTIRQSKDVDLRRRRNMTFYFCKTCKCFVTKYRKTVHLEASCKNISTGACEHCGLMFTTASLMTHRQLHKEKKDLSINHFKFFNLYDGRPINPAKPEALNTKRTAKIPKRHGRRNLTYHYCETCKCFLTKFNNAKLHKRKLCKNLSKTSCSYCGLMFTRASMMTHRRLHEERKDLTLKNLKFFNLHNGQPMNPPVTELTSINQSVNNEAEVESKERYKNIDNWHTRLNLTYYYCETCKCYITKFRKDAHLKGRCKKLAKMSCKHCGLMFTNASLVTHLRLHNEKADLCLKDFNFFNLYNGQPMNPPITKVTDSTRPVNTEVEILNIKRPVASEDACLLRPINKEAEPENGNLSIDIRARVVNENPALNIEAEAVNQTSTQRIGAEYKVNNESEALHFERPINIETEVRNENQSENIESEAVNATPLLPIQAKNEELFTNNESESLHFKRPINIEPKCGAIIQLVINKSQAENDLPSNIEADIECRLGAVNNEDRVSNIQVPSTTKTNDETEIEKLKLLVNNETENLKRFLSDLNNGPQVESSEMPIDSEVESPITTLQLLLNSGTTSNNKTDDKNKNRPEEHDAEVGHIIQPLSSTVEVAKIKRPVNLDVWRSKSNLTYHYCKNCNCYVTQFRKQTHLKARCRNLAKVTCKDCDLMFTSGSIMTHKRLHIENKNLTLKNFTFFNLYNGKPMNPSIPENENMKKTVNAEPGVVNMNQPEVVNKQTVNPEDEVVCIKQPSHNKPKVPHSKTSKKPEDWRRKLNLTLYFCETCKCFVTKYKKTAHLQARCNILAKMTCKRCGLTFTSASMMTHKRLHEEWNDLTLNNFTFFTLNGQHMNPPLPEVLHTNEPVSVETKVVNIKQSASKEANDAKVPRRNLTYYFCDTCQCFITKYNKKEAHLQARCKIFSTSKCKRCGLKFTKASIMAHKRLHTENKELSLKNFKFFNLYNGQPMKAPTPKAVNGKRLVEESNLTNYYCKTCKCFVSSHKKTAHVQANCMNMLKIPCKHCGLILCGTSFPLHKRLHEERKDLTLNHLKFFDLNSGQPMNPPIPEYPKCANCAVYFLTITAKDSHICSEVSSLTCHICEIKLSEAAFKLHMIFHQYATDNTNIIESATKLDRIVVNDITENSVTNTSNHKSNETDFHYSLDVSETPLQRSSDMYSIVYCCRNCSVSVDTYDKAVEHSHTHYETYEHETRTIHCNSCNLKIDEACYMAHQNLHESETTFKFLHFDSYYLPAENNLWIKHIFKTLPNEEVLDILRNSIYRFECRIKMDVIQKGDPNFTVYKCDQCNCFIDPTTLFKHSDYACFKLRNHPCTVCGIAFNSSASRIDHEKIHIRAGLTTESYRIVIFNRERDLQVNRSFCLRKNYVLYKCRYCDVIIEKPREDIHKCDFTNVKNCPHCALLLNIKDYESHLNIHENFISFNYSNMKVVLLGESKSLEIRSEKNLRSKFKGVIYDYKMFVCNKCEICIKNEHLMPKHICRFGKQRLKCLKCGLYFSVGRLKTHMRRHAQDPDFIRSNMCMISFDPCTLDQNKNATKLVTKDKNCELSDSNTDSDLECVSANDTGAGNDTETADVTTEIVEEETVRIYKCSCDLHFLNEDSIFRHFGTCRSNSKITKLKCHKCGLLFTSNVLFTHMLAHHNNKCRRYKYDVIKVCYN